MTRRVRLSQWRAEGWQKVEPGRYTHPVLGAVYRESGHERSRWWWQPWGEAPRGPHLGRDTALRAARVGMPR